MENNTNVQHTWPKGTKKSNMAHKTKRTPTIQPHYNRTQRPIAGQAKENYEDI
jgi:hypothetical protein